jgi:hypothetical protein
MSTANGVLMVVGLFGYKMKSDADAHEFETLAFRMYELVSSGDFGFCGMTTYSAPDGEELIVAHFESIEGLEAWGRQPEHVVVQERARVEFFDRYWAEICTVERATRFDLEGGHQTEGR